MRRRGGGGDIERPRGTLRRPKHVLSLGRLVYAKILGRGGRQADNRSFFARLVEDVCMHMGNQSPSTLLGRDLFDKGMHGDIYIKRRMRRNLTDPSTILESQNLSHEVLEIHKFRRSPDYLALKLGEGRRRLDCASRWS